MAPGDRLGHADLCVLVDPEPGDGQVPDPYYGGPQGFDHVFDLCEAACEGLLTHIKNNHVLR